MRPRTLLTWIAVAAAGALLVARGHPAAFPFAPRGWSVTAEAATAVALEQLRDLGEPVADAYVVTRIGSNPLLERRLQLAGAERGIDTVRGGYLADQVLYWEVLVYEPGARPGEWTYRARIGLTGGTLALQLRMPAGASAGAAEPPAARQEADRFLAEQGFDLSRFEEPEVRARQLEARTDLTLRYRYRELELGERFAYGEEVRFSGPRLSGRQPWFDDPDEDRLQAALRPISLLNVGRNLTVLVLLPLVAVPFLRRYHAGEVGVRRGLEIGGLTLASSVALMAVTARAFSEGTAAGLLTRTQITWLTGLWLTGFIFLPVAIVTVLAWSVGESYCRERWGQKLAAFDALFQGDWNNATVARSALRGNAAGLALAGLLLAAGAGLRRLDAWPAASFEISAWIYSSHWAGPVILLFLLIFALYAELFGRVFLVPFLGRRLGLWIGAGAAAVVAGILCWGPSIWLLSLGWMLVLGVLVVAALVALFLRYDLLTSLLTGLTASSAVAAMPLLAAGDPWLQFQGSLVGLGVAAPLLASVRCLAGGREFVYRYDDVPPHVRRIAERERHKVELETARRIQTSILPDLPPELHGVRIAHTYLPATEVGGDFYDVLALDDGRLAVAVGDVAGHGVSSGLVMSMARSALAVQVTFRPEVEAVFGTLNRMVFQSARRRLLTTLCYALLDPRRREILYASAGHLFPYRIRRDGAVRPLESISYPLGVRRELAVAVRQERLAAGDRLFLFSDGVVEARGPDDEEPYGFDRLEAALRRLAGEPVTGLRDGVLADLERFTAGAPREDDLTLLVLEIP